MNKKILCALSFAFVMIFAIGMMSLTANAEGNVAKIGETEYATIHEAVNAATNGQTITLLQDVEFESTLEISGKTITIDGGNHTLYDYADTVDQKVKVNNASVTFKNIFITKKTTVKKGYGTFYMGDNSTVILGDNAVIGGIDSENLMQGNVAGVAWVQGTNSKFELNGEGAKIQYTLGTWNNGIIGFNGTAYTGQINLLKGEIIGCKHNNANMGIVSAAGKNVTVTIGDVTFRDNLNPDVAVIATSDKPGTSSSVGNIIVTGAANVPKIRANSSDITISGNFTGNVGLTLLDEAEPASYVKIAEGATITGTIKDNADGATLIVKNGNLVKDYAAQVGDTKYATLNAAISAVTNNGTVKLLKDISVDSLISISGKTFTIDGDDGDGNPATKYTVTVNHSANKGFSVAGGAVLTIKNVRFTGMTTARSYAYFHLTGNNTTVIMGDYAEISGTKDKPIYGGNGGAFFTEGTKNKVIIDGEGALIEYVIGRWGGGVVSAWQGNAVVELHNGTIRNCTEENSMGIIHVKAGCSAIITGGTITDNKGRGVSVISGGTVKISGGTISNNSNYGVTVGEGGITEITGGTITGNTNYGVAVNGGGTLKISGNPTITENKSGNIHISDYTGFLLTGNFTGKAGITLGSGKVQLGTATAAGFTGLENFYKDGSTVKVRYYVPGTKFANETSQAVVEERNEGKETALIFDYAFSLCDAGQDFLKAGVPAENWNTATQNGKIVYLLRDITIEDVANAGGGGEYGPYHINLSSKGANYTYDGNGFEFKIYETNNGKNFSKKQHVFRLYNQVNVVMNNFVYDGSDIMGFVDAGWVNATNFGGNLTLDNCLIKNCTRGNGGAVANVTDGKIVIRNTIIENATSSNAGGALYVGTPKEASMKSELVIEDSVIRNADGSRGGAIMAIEGTEVTITGTTIENCEASNGGGISTSGKLTMSDSVIKNCVTVGNATNGGGIILWETASATLTDVVIDSCTGPANGGICVLGHLELLGNSEIKNCHSDAVRAGLSVIETVATATIGGDVKIVNNTAGANNTAANIHNSGTITLASDFKGNLGFATPGTIEVEEGLTSFVKINTLFLDNDAAKYPNITEGKTISWELIPTIAIETDAAWLYKDAAHTEYASDKSGLVRFVTTFVDVPAAGLITNYGTYLVSAETNELGGITTVATFSENTDKIAPESFYVVDAVGIANGETKSIYGLSYVTLKNIDTPIYFDYIIHTIDEASKKIIVKA